MWSFYYFRFAIEKRLVKLAPDANHGEIAQLARTNPSVFSWTDLISPVFGVRFDRAATGSFMPISHLDEMES